MSTWHTLLFGDGVTYVALLMFKDVNVASLLILNKMWPLKYIVNAIVMCSSKKHTIMHFNIGNGHLLKGEAL
jgi:hypothetical protein